MVMSNMEVINAVKHYQRNIERCSGNVERMLHCLQKLYRLPVTVQHLQETGVGRTVNALRKYEGDTGEAAKALVNKWKAMVAEAESSEEEVPEETPCVRTESPPPPSSSYKHRSSNSDSHREESQSEKGKSKERNHTSSNHSDKRRDEKSSSKSRHSDQGHKRRHEEETRRDEEKRRRNNVVEIADKEEEEEEEEDDDDDEEEEVVCDNGQESPEDDESDQVTAEDSDRENDEKENEASNAEEMDVDQDLQEDSDSSDVEHVPEVQVKHRTHSSNRKEGSHGSQSDHRKSSHSSHSSRNHRDEIQKSDSSRKKSNHSVDHRPSKKSEGKSDSSKIESKSNSVHSSSNSRESKSLNKEKERQREKDKNKEKERERNRTEVKKKEESRKVSKNEKREEKSKSHIPKQESKPSTSSSKSSSKTENKNKSSSSKKVKAPVEETEDGIDSFSGTSFADALGMMGMVDNVSKKKKKVSGSGSSSSKKTDGSSVNQTGSSSSSTHKPKGSTPGKSSSQSKISSPEDINLLDPLLQLAPLDTLDVDVDATLPAINPNYRPLPHLNFDMPSRARAKTLTEEEALSQVMSTKNQRTKVYSGVKNAKSFSQVPSLFELCVRVLQENIDALEYTGGVPYDLLRPVLVLATPEQLFALEHYNPYFVEDTDELWESHVRRKFRSERRLDMETYREMYQRCVEESEAKLKALTKNIQNSMAKSLPVRQTKLAYVDSVAKPPRQVARKQAKFGTANATATTPMAKVQKLATPSSTSTNRSIQAPAPRTPPSAKVKPRMAPLMQKTMKLAKSFKR